MDSNDIRESEWWKQIRSLPLIVEPNGEPGFETLRGRGAVGGNPYRIVMVRRLEAVPHLVQVGADLYEEDTPHGLLILSHVNLPGEWTAESDWQGALWGAIGDDLQKQRPWRVDSTARVAQRATWKREFEKRRKEERRTDWDGQRELLYAALGEPDNQESVEELERGWKSGRAQQVAASIGEPYSSLLCQRFGLDGNPPMTLQAIAEVRGVSRSRIWQIESKALRLMRHPSRSRQLRIRA